MRSISQVQAKLKQKPKDGAERLALIDQLHVIAHRALVEIHKVDLGPGDSLVGPVKSARAKFVDRLDKATKALQDADDLAAGLSKLLRGPSKYLVLAANNAEMRDGSGMLLSAGVMTMQDGKLDLGDMRSTDDLTLPPVRSRCRPSSRPCGDSRNRPRTGATSRPPPGSTRSPRSARRCGRSSRANRSTGSSPSTP